MTRPDFTTPPHPPQFSGWANVMRWSANLPSRMRRILAVDPRAVSPRCWRWLVGASMPGSAGLTA